MLYHKQLDASFSPGSLEFNTRLLHMKFVVDEVAPEQTFLQVRQFSSTVHYLGCLQSVRKQNIGNRR
jgi:hypothetical protein